MFDDVTESGRKEGAEFLGNFFFFFFLDIGIQSCLCGFDVVGARWNPVLVKRWGG